MKQKKILSDIWDGIRTQPGRMGLSFTAIAVGIASLTVLIAVLQNLQEKSQQIVRELGVNVVGIIQQAQNSPNARGALQQRHASLLARNLPSCAVSTMRRYEVPTLGRGELLSVIATDSSLIRIRQWQMHEGRFLDQRDIKDRQRSAVISRSLSKLWNWKIGNIIMLRNTPFKIAGIVNIGGGTLDTELADPGLALGEHVVFVPKTVVPSWAINQKNPEAGIDAIFLHVPPQENFERAVSTAGALLSQPDYRLDGISWVTPESLISGVKRLQNIIKLTVGSIAFLCLILGGTTLMSIMVANVRERVTEIGLRRAMGASQWDIAGLFVMEACVITCASAVVAMTGTHLLLIMGGHALSVPLSPGFASLFIPLIVAVILGMFFSYLPAKFAARITPSEALRNE